jgi:hypothetical protein
MQQSLPSILDFVSHASARDLEQISSAIELRRPEALEQWRASVSAGDSVRLDRITPALLKGLTGTVVGRKPNSKVKYLVRLDEHSTAYLRGMRDPKFPVRPDATELELPVHVGCLEPYDPSRP